MKLFWGPHTCAIGIHILLEEIGNPYETEKIDVAGGATHRQPFSTLNPKMKVPVLVRNDGSILTEYTAIATWLARSNPDKHLIAEDADGEARGLEIMNYVEGTLHGQGFYRLIKPELFEPSNILNGKMGLGKENIQEQGRKIITDALTILDKQMAGCAYVAGDQFTIADTALFSIERWAPPNKIALPPNLAAHLERMKARPCVRKVMQLWGELEAPPSVQAA